MKRLAVIKESISSSISLDNLKCLQITKEDLVGTIWLNSPSNHNALSVRMLQQFNYLLPLLDNDKEVKIILIRTKNAKAFCAGADIKNFLSNYNDNRYNAVRSLNFAKVFRMVRKPIIAVVDGLAYGGGFEMCLLCDVILCSEKATFALPQIKLGIIPGMGGTQILSRIVGTKVASRLIMSGQTITAAEASQLNIVHMYSSDKFEQGVKEFATTLTNRALDSLQAAKKAVRLAMETTLNQGLEHEATIFQALFGKECQKEGLAAFVEKRKPNFKNI